MYKFQVKLNHVKVKTTVFFVVGLLRHEVNNTQNDKEIYHLFLQIHRRQIQGKFWIPGSA